MNPGRVAAREFRCALAELWRVADYAAEAERIFRRLRAAGGASGGEKRSATYGRPDFRGQSTAAVVRDPAG